MHELKVELEQGLEFLRREYKNVEKRLRDVQIREERIAAREKAVTVWEMSIQDKMQASCKSSSKKN